MTRLWLCILVLGGTVAFLSCGSDNGLPDGGTANDGSGPSGTGGTGGTIGTGGMTGMGGTGTAGHTDGGGPVAGRGGGAGHTDGAGPSTGRGGFIGSDGAAPSGGRGGGCPAGCDGHGAVAGRGGAGGSGGRGGFTAFDGTGPVGGRGGGGGQGPCSGLGYFQERGWCAPTYGAQLAKQVPGNCDYVTVFTVDCVSVKAWKTEYRSLGDPLLCVYDSAGDLIGARICTDTTMPAWNCSGAPQSPMCLSSGTVPNIQACAQTTSCGVGGRGGGSGADGTGPIGGRGGA